MGNVAVSASNLTGRKWDGQITIYAKIEDALKDTAVASTETDAGTADIQARYHLSYTIFNHARYYLIPIATLMTLYVIPHTRAHTSLYSRLFIPLHSPLHVFTFAMFLNL